MESTEPGRVLVVGWDGVRADAAAAAATPNLDSLAAHGGLSVQATTHLTGPHVSAPGWMSVFTGAVPEDHGVLVNGVYDGRDEGARTFVDHAAEAGLTTAAAVAWPEIVTDILESDAVDETHLGSEDSVADFAITQFEIGADLVVVHQDAPDHAGHATGFSTDNLEYIEAIEAADVRLGRMLDVIPDGTLVLVTTDHGGEGTSHGPTNEANHQIFLAGGVWGQPGGWDMSGASHLDVFPTVLGFLGLDPGEVPGVDRSATARP